MKEKNNSIFRCYLRMWAKIFNYKGTSSGAEYWGPFIIQMFVFVIDACIIISAWVVYEDPTIRMILLLPICIALFYLFISFVPWASLTVRSFRGGEKIFWSTVLILVLLIGLTIQTHFCCKVIGNEFIDYVNGDVYSDPGLPMDW